MDWVSWFDTSEGGLVGADIGVLQSRAFGVAEMPVSINRVGVSFFAVLTALLFVFSLSVSFAGAQFVKLPSTVDSDNKFIVNLAGVASTTVNGACTYAFYDNEFPASTTEEQGGVCVVSDWEDPNDTLDLDLFTNNSGFFWLWFNSNVTGINYYAVATCDGQVCVGDAQGQPFNPLGNFSYGFSSNLNTKFLTLDVDNASGSDDIQIDISYFLDENEVNTSIPEFNPTSVSASFVERPLTEFSLIGTNIDNDDTATQTVSIIIPESSTDGDGTYDLLIQFDNLNRLFSGVRPFAQVFVYTQFTLVSKEVTSTGTPEFYDVSDVSTTTTTYRACGITAIDGCVVNAFSFLFVPTDNTTNSFASLIDKTENKFPFAYFFAVKDIIESAEEGTDTIIKLVLASPTSSPIQYNVEYFSEAQMRVFFDDGSIILFRGIIEVVLWLALMSMMFYSVRGVFNSQSV